MRLIDVLEPVLDEDDYAVYLIGCAPKRLGWRGPLLALGLLLPWVPLITPEMDFTGTWYLVAFKTHGTLGKH